MLVVYLDCVHQVPNAFQAPIGSLILVVFWCRCPGFGAIALRRRDRAEYAASLLHDRALGTRSRCVKFSPFYTIALLLRDRAKLNSLLLRDRAEAM